MNLWLDGLSALTGHASAAFVIILIILWGFFIARGILHRLFGDALSESDLLLLSAAGWVLPVLFLSLFTFGISLLLNSAIGGIFAAAMLFVSSFMFIRKRLAFSTAFPFLILFLVSIIIRFAFIEDLLLPSYFDSAEHYRLIKAVIGSYQQGVLTNALTGNFYHLGFHYLAGSISHFLHINVIELMLVFGQIMLAVIPFSIFFIIKRETNSTSAAFLTCLLASFGFHMPAHLMNWGKYPALLSLISMFFVFSLAYMAYRNDIFKNRRPIFILLVIAILASTLIHSRTLVLYGLMFIAALITFGWSRMRNSYWVFGVHIILFILVIFSIQNDSALNYLLESYLKNDSWSLALILVLTIFSSIHYTKATFFLFTWLTLCMLCLFVPITFSVDNVQTLLDRPFVQMFIYIPLSMLGGFGFAGLMRWTQRLISNSNLIQRFESFFIFGLVLLNAALNYNFYPADCCRFATRDDLAAFTWVDETLPPDITILIASTNLYVTSFEASETQAGVDAGVWLAPLLSRNVKFGGQGIQFDEANVHKDLCERNVEYIYVGGMPQSFNSLQLDSQPLWYSSSFALPAAKIYQVVGCEG